MSLKYEIDLILKEERRVLMSGDIYKLESLIKNKEDIIERIDSNFIELSKEDISDIKYRASQNDRLMRAVEKGIKSAIYKIGNIANNGESKTYTKLGHREVLNKGNGSVHENI